MTGTFMRSSTVILPLLALAACGETGDNADRNAADPVIAIKRSADDGGNVSINLPGFDANIRVPSGVMGGGKVDISGVSLFPGASVTAVNVGGKGKGFDMTFDAPADASTVQKWFLDRFAEKGVIATAEGAIVSGTTTEGKPFTIAMSPAADGKSTGTITVERAKN